MAGSSRSETRGKAFFAAAGVLVLLVAVNAIVVSGQGNQTRGFPHNYLYTALQKYYGTLEFIQQDGVWNTAWHEDVFDNIDSPLYAISTLLGRIGAPTGFWFRMTGNVILVLIFLTAYFMHPPPKSSRVRLLTALCVSSTPVVLFTCRHLEDWSFHILVMMLAAMILLRSQMGKIGRIAWLFYLLPALDLYVCLITTNFLVMMMSFGGIYLYAISHRLLRDKKRAVAILAGEIPRWALAFAALYLVHRVRFPYEEDLFYFGYMLGEAQHIYERSASWLVHLLAYPSLLLFETAGVTITGLALLALTKKFRPPHALMYWLWTCLPIILLLVFNKKNGYYAWILTAGLSLLAAGVIEKFPPRLQRAGLVLFCLYAVLHTLFIFTPLKAHTLSQAFELEGMQVSEPPRDNNQHERDVREQAERMLKLIELCGPVQGRPVVVHLAFAPHDLTDLYFTMLSLDQRPRYWLIQNNLPEDTRDFVLIVTEKQGPIDRNNHLFDYFDQVKKRVQNDLQLVHQSEMDEVYCPKDTAVLTTP